MTIAAGQARLRPRPPRIEYQAPEQPLPPDALWAVHFGATAPGTDPRCMRVGLTPLAGAPLAEVWRVDEPVTTGREGAVQFARSTHFLAGRIEVDERDAGGIEAAARRAYETICAFQAGSAQPHLLRVWNYFDAVNSGEGDEERYRLFCAGRVAGIEGYTGARWPAATAIGRRDGQPLLQVYWLAGRDPGLPLENPRQVNAYQYPRQYGPSPPVFSRATLVAGELLLISGTASILGHASHHPGDLERQLDETLNNLASLQRGGAAASSRPVAGAGGSVLKVYLRNPDAASAVEAALRKRLPPETRWLLLQADVCRRELLVEVDCVQPLL